MREPFLPSLTLAAALVAAACASRHPLPPPVDAPPPPPPAPTAEADADLSARAKSETLPLGVVEELAIRHDPGLAERRSAIEASRGREEQAGTWPNPRLALQARDVPTQSFGLDEGGSWVTVAQPFAPSGRIGMARDAAAAERRALGWEFEAARRRLIADVRRTSADLAAAEASRALAEEVATGADELLAAGREREKRGAASREEVALLEIESERMGGDVRRTEREVASARARLQVLLGGSAPKLAHVTWPDAGTGSPVHEEVDDHPAVRAAVTRIEAARRSLELARVERMPDFEVLVSYGRVGPTEAEMVEAGVSIAIPVFDRNRGNIRDAEAQIEGAKASADRMRAELSARRMEALADLAAATVDASSHRDRIVPAAERVAAQIERAFQSGARSATDLTLARRALATARRGLVEAEQRLRRAWADLDELGRPVPAAAGPPSDPDVKEEVRR